MYLWDLSLDSIPLGWEKFYETAIKETSHGETFALPDSEYYYNIPDCKELLETNFKSLKNEATILFKDLSSNLNRIERLIEIDICLYSIIEFWTRDEREYSSFNPNELQLDIYNSNLYFSPSSIEMYKYDKMKFIHLSKPFRLR